MPSMILHGRLWFGVVDDPGFVALDGVFGKVENSLELGDGGVGIGVRPAGDDCGFPGSILLGAEVGGLV